MNTTNQTNQTNQICQSSQIKMSEQVSETCFACGMPFYMNGWAGLCNRTCFFDMMGLLVLYQNDEVGEPHPQLVKYFLKYPDGGSLCWFEKIEKYIKDLTKEHLELLLSEDEIEVEEEKGCTCMICGEFSDDYTGWKDLCSRSCYYDMAELLYDYEEGRVEVPDMRVVQYFNVNPDGGGHTFYPDKIFKYIENSKI